MILPFITSTFTWKLFNFLNLIGTNDPFDQDDRDDRDAQDQGPSPNSDEDKDGLTLAQEEV